MLYDFSIVTVNELCCLWCCVTGGADPPEVRALCDRAWTGAGALCAGAGQSPTLHDPKGTDQHWSLTGEAAHSARAVPPCEWGR